MALEEIKVPDIGEYSGVDVIEINVAVGDQINEEDTLITLETDKATMEIPAPQSGVIKEILVGEGSKVSEGDLIIKLDATTTSGETQTMSHDMAANPEPQNTNHASQVMDVAVPDIGEYSGVDIIEINVAVGDQVEEETPLITLETDKATMEVPSPMVGTVKEILVKEGGKVSQGDLIVKLELAAVAKTLQPTAETPVAKTADHQPAPTKPVPAAVSEPQNANVHASPAIRRIAREFGVDLSKVTATGRKGRITKDDLQEFVKHAMASGGSAGDTLGLLADPVVDFAKFGEVDVQPLPRIKKISGANLHRNWVKIPHITLFEDADITDLEAFRQAKKVIAEKQGVKLTPVPFIVKAVAKALKAYPIVNSALSADGQSLVYKKYVNVGVAVDTPHGLMVPVIRDADKKGIYDIARDLIDLSLKARDGKLAPSDMQGGCFTISSLGGIGTTAFTPIVNMPEVGILGVSKAAIKPVYDGSSFVPKLMLPLSLSLDHRVVDGAEGGRFLAFLRDALGDLRELLL